MTNINEIVERELFLAFPESAGWCANPYCVSCGPRRSAKAACLAVAKAVVEELRQTVQRIETEKIALWHSIEKETGRSLAGECMGAAELAAGIYRALSAGGASEVK